MSASREKNRRKELATNAPVNQESAQKKTMSKGLKGLLVAVGLIVVIAALVFFTLVNNGHMARKATVAVVGDHKISAAEFNYFYRDTCTQFTNNNSSSLGALLDTTKPLYEQYYDKEAGITWADYFTDEALTSVANMYTFYDMAMESGFEVTEEIQSQIDYSVGVFEHYYSLNGFESPEAMLIGQYGAGSDLESFREYVELNSIVSAYLNKQYNTPSFTEEEMAAEYEAGADDFDTVTYRLFNVSDILFDEEDPQKLEELKKNMANDIATATKGNELSFIATAYENASESSKQYYETSDYTLNAYVSKANCAAALAEWLFDAQRQSGDTTYIRNSLGTYQVLYFVSRDTHDYELPTIRHILFSVADPADTAAMDEAKAAAEETLAAYLAGEQTEDAFAALATEKSEDTTTSFSGGLLENVEPGTLESAFNEWCFEEKHEPGDTALLETSYGWHIVYFCSYGENYRDLLVDQALRTDAYSVWFEEVTADITYDVNERTMKFVTK